MARSCDFAPLYPPGQTLQSAVPRGGRECGYVGRYLDKRLSNELREKETLEAQLIDTVQAYSSEISRLASGGPRLGQRAGDPFVPT